MRFVKAVCCAAALTAVMAPGARADEWNKKTILTFSGPVQIPGVTLPAGSYATVLLAEVMKTNIAEEGEPEDDDGDGEQ